MSDAFIAAGAETYFGVVGERFTWTLSAIGEVLFSVLTDTTNFPDPHDRTTGQAFDAASGSGVFNLVNDSNLVVTGGVIDGGFENGGLIGWQRNFEPGAGDLKGRYCGDGELVCTPADDGEYSQPATEQVHSGQESARIGKWGQKYDADKYETCDQSLPKVEQAGDNQIYQDVKLGSGATHGGPTSFSLSFYYDIQTYDDSQDDDYFYVRLLDPSTTPASLIDEVMPKTLPPGAGCTGDKATTGWQRKVYTIPKKWAGKTVRILFGVHDDGWGDQTTAYVDDVQITCGP